MDMLSYCCKKNKNLGGKKMFKKAGLISLILLMSISLLVIGCGENQNAQEEGLSGNLVLAGSTSVQPLAEELAMRFMELNRNVKIDVAGGGSGAGVESSANGAADIGMASREVKDEELAAHPDLKPIVIAQDGIIVIVNQANPVNELTLVQIKGIFTGEITNWQDVGGKNAAITVINREEGSGTRTAFNEIVLHGESFTDKAAIQNSTGAVKTAVNADENAIGYISMGSMSDQVKGLKVNGVEPTIDNAKNGDYPIARPFIFITKGEPDGLTKAFIDWVMSGEAQEIIQEEGFIPVQ